MHRFICILYLTCLCFDLFGEKFQHIKDNSTLIEGTVLCSFQNKFTTAQLTGEQPTSTCYQKPFAFGKWFQFEANSPNNVIRVKVDDSPEGMRWPRISIWDENFNEIKCEKSIDDITDISLEYTNYVVGKSYYISINHNNHPDYVGYFSICLNNTLNNNTVAGATKLNETTDWHSNFGAFSTISATGEGPSGSCMSGGPNFNRWFKFVASTESIELEVKTGDKLGSMKNPYLTLFNKSMLEIECDKFIDNVECKITIDKLVIGNTYYFSVDHAKNDLYKGSFTLFMDNGATLTNKKIVEVPPLTELILYKLLATSCSILINLLQIKISS